MDLAVAVRVFHAVIDGVFQDRLDDQLDGIQSLHTLLHGDVCGEFVFIPHFLNGQIVPGVLQLVLDGDDAAALAEGYAEKSCQRRQHGHRLLRPSVFRHPYHAVQRIVEEMGIDLRLQHVQLAAPLFLLLPENVLHQMTHGGHHGLHGAAEMLHLVRAVHIEIHGLRALFQLTHRKLQLLHGRSDPL